MLKKFILTLTVLIILRLIWFLWVVQTTPDLPPANEANEIPIKTVLKPTPTPIPLPTQTPTPIPVASQKAATQASLPMVKTTDRAALEDPEFLQTVAEEGLLPFTLAGDLAITHGDVILGELHLPDGKKIKAGVTKPPEIKLWPDGVLPYKIAANHPLTEAIKTAINYFHEHTNIRFVSYKTEMVDGIHFLQGKEHCLSYLGKRGGLQPLYINKGCGVNEIIHEIMHALGFFHEQSRTDRDDYLKIIWNNVKDKQKINFSKVPESFMAILQSSPFDFTSRMMYQEFVFSKNKKPTIAPRYPAGDGPAPVKFGLSVLDLDRLYNLYQQ